MLLDLLISTLFPVKQFIAYIVAKGRAEMLS